MVVIFEDLVLGIRVRVEVGWPGEGIAAGKVDVDWMERTVGTELGKISCCLILRFWLRSPRFTGQLNSTQPGRLKTKYLTGRGRTESVI